MTGERSDGSGAVTSTQFQACAGVEDWRVVVSGASAWFRAPSQVAGAALVRLAQTAKTQGRPRQAKIWVRESVGLLRGRDGAALRDAKHPHQRRAAVEGAWLALAHTLHGDLEQTCQVGRLTISRLGAVQSDRCSTALTALRGELRSGRMNNPDVREFVGELDRTLHRQPPRHDAVSAQGPGG